MNDDASGNSDVWYKPFDGSTMQPARLISTERGLLRPGDARKRLSSPLRSWLATVVILSGGSLLILNKHSKTVKMQCCLLRYANFFPLVDPPQSQNKPSGRLPCASNGIVPVDLGFFYPLHHRSGLHVR